jgi:hypothetical protein
MEKIRIRDPGKTSRIRNSDDDDALFAGRIAVITNAFIIAFTSEFIPKES